MSKEQTENNMKITPNQEQLYRFIAHHESRIVGVELPQEIEGFVTQCVQYGRDLEKNGSITLNDPKQIESWNTLVQNGFTLGPKQNP